MIHAIGFLFIIAASVALGYLILTGLYPDIAPAVSLIIYGCTAYVVTCSAGEQFVVTPCILRVSENWQGLEALHAPWWSSSGSTERPSPR